MIRLSTPVIGPEEQAAVAAVVASGRLAQGEQVAAFEREFADFCGVEHAVAVSSGTSALHLGLVAAGIGPGDEVVVPSFTFAATANAVVLAGATPVFADIDPVTFCLDPDAVAAALTERTAAIMPVHLFGHPAATDRLGALAARHGLLLLEDAAQAHGATRDGRTTGALGDVAAFSFYATKNMTTGEGGMICTGDAAVAERARLLRNQGMRERYRNEVVGHNARMTDVAAAIGRVQLGRLPGWNEHRRDNAARYDKLLEGVVVPAVEHGVEHVYHQYTVRVAEGRERVQERLTAAGVEHGVYYPVPVHRLPSFDSPAHLPETERACAEVLSLPVGPLVTSTDVERVAEVIR